MIYEADIEMAGEERGTMKCRITLSKIDFCTPPRILFSAGADGNPKSSGYAEYNGIRLNVSDMAE